MTELNKTPVLTDEETIKRLAVKLLETYNWGAGSERDGYYDPVEAMDAINSDAIDIHKHYMKVIEQVRAEAYELGYSDARREYEPESKKVAQEIFKEIEKHLNEYQWVEKPDYTKRHYPYCPTDFYELKQKYGVE